MKESTTPSKSFDVSGLLNGLYPERQEVAVKSSSKIKKKRPAEKIYHTVPISGKKMSLHLNKTKKIDTKPAVSLPAVSLPAVLDCDPTYNAQVECLQSSLNVRGRWHWCCEDFHDGQCPKQ